MKRGKGAGVGNLPKSSVGKIIRVTIGRQKRESIGAKCLQPGLPLLYHAVLKFELSEPR